MERNRLLEIRNGIDALDRELSRLLEARFNLVSEVADYKKQAKTGIYDAARESEVIENALSVVKNPEYHPYIEESFKSLMSISKAFQQKKLSQAEDRKKRFGLIGEKLSHSVSPAIHSHLFNKTGLEASYELCEVPACELPVLLERLRKEGYSGINVTIPYKTDIMRYLDALSDEALRVGAVNTILIGSKTKGYNTDYYGFGRALAFGGFAPSGKRCAVLGSGGSSRAAVSYLEDHGAAHIAIVSRDTDAAGLKFPGLQAIELGEFEASGFDLIVNATPVGMHPMTDLSPLAKDQLKGASFVVDLIYNPSETLFLKYARELGIRGLNGLYMLVAQAVCAEEIWNGTEYDAGLIDEIYREMIEK